MVSIYSYTIVIFLQRRLKCILTLHVFIHSFRGESFCYDFLQLGEIRSIIPSTTNVLALTATASKAVFEAAINTLRMKSPEVISVTPGRSNIFLSVVEKREVIEVVQDIATVVLPSQASGPSIFPKTLVFCRKYTVDREIFSRK